MKVIDLLNKIANGEEVPKKIIVKNRGIVIENIDEYVLYDKLYEEYIYINDEVEIIEEEKKIPEKITINDNGTIGFPNGEWTARNMDKAFAMKINSIIDYLKSKGDE